MNYHDRGTFLQLFNKHGQEELSLEKVAKLILLNGIGSMNSWTFVMEFFGWRQFQNEQEMRGLAGFTPTPYESGKSL